MTVTFTVVCVSMASTVRVHKLFVLTHVSTQDPTPTTFTPVFVTGQYLVNWLTLELLEG